MGIAHHPTIMVSIPVSVKPPLPDQSHFLIYVLNTIGTCENDIADAIKELAAYSYSPDGDIQAKVLKSCSNHLSHPLFLLWKSYFEYGLIPGPLKIQYVTQVFKKGDQIDAANLRPIGHRHNINSLRELSAKVDKVDLHILLSKFERYGIGGEMLQWIKKFLLNRFQAVVVKGENHHSA